MKRIAIINSSSPFNNNAGKDALDLALIFGSYEQNISLFFHDDGVYQLTPHQQPERIKQKDYLKTFAAFDLYDIENVYVCQTSLSDRGLSNVFHIEHVTVVSKQEFSDLLNQHHAVFRF